MEILLEPTSNKLMVGRSLRIRSDEVLTLKNFKKDALLELFKLSNKERYEHVGPKSQVHKMVGLSARVESSKDEGLGEEDASKQGRIADIDANKDMYLVNVHNDEDMFGVNNSDGDEVIVEDVSVVDKVNVVSTAITTTAIIDDITLAKALIKIKNVKPKTIDASTRPKAKGLVIHEQKQAPTPTVSSQQPSQVKVKGQGKMVEPEPVKKMLKKDHLVLDEELAFKLQAEEEKKGLQEKKLNKLKKRKLFVAKRAEEKRNIPSTRAQQRTIICTYLKNMKGWKLKSLKKKSFAEIREFFDKAMKKVNTFDDFKTKLVEESSKKAEAEITQEDDGDDVTIDATPLSSKSPTIVDYKIYKEGRKTIFKFLELMNQQGLVKVKNWKLYASCEVHCVTMQNILYYLLVEKMYPFTNHTLHQMFNDVKLQVDYECEMAFELLRLVKKQLKE
nr:hypothetical protein [Tanacetum cinerariifolium]